MRTSNLALALQVSAAAMKIIPVATAVFAFQFLGCAHQPPGEQSRVQGDILARYPTRIRQCVAKTHLLDSKLLSGKDVALRLP
jgi:RNase P/RNase MRP subunit p29